MTEQQHPITPPPELVQQWWKEADKQLSPYYDYIATQAARWGADQELYECLQLLDINGCPSKWIDMLRDARRRPKPPSLAEQALMGLEQTVIMLMPVTGRKKNERFDTIRRALERLKELESNG